MSQTTAQIALCSAVPLVVAAAWLLQPGRLPGRLQRFHEWREDHQARVTADRVRRELDAGTRPR